MITQNAQNTDNPVDDIWNSLIATNPNLNDFIAIIKKPPKNPEFTGLALCEIYKLVDEWSEDTFNTLIQNSWILGNNPYFDWEILYEFGVDLFSDRFVLIDRFPEEYNIQYDKYLWEDHKVLKTVNLRFANKKSEYTAAAIENLKHSSFIALLSPKEIGTLTSSQYVADSDKQYFWECFIRKNPSVLEVLEITHFGLDFETIAMQYIVDQKPDVDTTLECLSGLPSRNSEEILIYALTTYRNNTTILLDFFEGHIRRTGEVPEMLARNQRLHKAVIDTIPVVVSLGDKSLLFAVLDYFPFNRIQVDRLPIAKRLLQKEQEAQSEGDVFIKFMRKLLSIEQLKQEVAQFYLSKAKNASYLYDEDCLERIVVMPEYQDETIQILFEQQLFNSESTLDRFRMLSPTISEKIYKHQNNSTSCLLDQIREQ